MPDLSPLYDILGFLPLECLQMRFMQRALLALLLLAPMAAMLGVEVVSFRMAFFSDAIGHSAFTGVALGLLLNLDPQLSMPIFAVLMGLGILAVSRKSKLSADTSIGIVFSATVAFGLAVVSSFSGLGRGIQQFLYGDILTLNDAEVGFLALLFALTTIFQFFGCNRLLSVALNPAAAPFRGSRAALWQYCFVGLLALVVAFSIRAVGILLVTALLVTPAAAARNFAHSVGSMFRWAALLGLVSATVGLLLPAAQNLPIPCGAAIILTACAFFSISLVYTRFK